MISNDKIAAATIAQIFGSELLRVDSNTSEVGNQCLPATRIDPKKILLDGQSSNTGTSDREKKMLEVLQREAESTHPLYDQIQQPATSLVEQSNQTSNQTSEQKEKQLIFANSSNASSLRINDEILSKINSNLEKIGNSLQQIAQCFSGVNITFQNNSNKTE